VAVQRLARAVALWFTAAELSSGRAARPIAAGPLRSDLAAMSPFAAPQRSPVAAAGRGPAGMAGRAVAQLLRALRSAS
jgi:hypothetical protein